MEDAYHFLSTLASLIFPGQSLPEDVYTLEKENSAWIDFLWSTLGGCGRVGGDVGSVYEASKDAASLQRITDTLAESVASNCPVPNWAPRFLREWTLKAALYGAAAVLVGEDLSAVSIRWYNEGRYTISVEEPTAPGAARSAFCDQISGFLQEHMQSWKEFEETVQSEVELRRKRKAAKGN